MALKDRSSFGGGNISAPNLNASIAALANVSRQVTGFQDRQLRESLADKQLQAQQARISAANSRQDRLLQEQLGREAAAKQATGDIAFGDVTLGTPQTAGDGIVPLNVSQVNAQSQLGNVIQSSLDPATQAGFDAVTAAGFDVSANNDTKTPEQLALESKVFDTAFDATLKSQGLESRENVNTQLSPLLADVSAPTSSQVLQSRLATAAQAGDTNAIDLINATVGQEVKAEAAGKTAATKAKVSNIKRKYDANTKLNQVFLQAAKSGSGKDAIKFGIPSSEAIDFAISKYSLADEADAKRYLTAAAAYGLNDKAQLSLIQQADDDSFVSSEISEDALKRIPAGMLVIYKALEGGKSIAELEASGKIPTRADRLKNFNSNLNVAEAKQAKLDSKFDTDIAGASAGVDPLGNAAADARAILRGVPVAADTSTVVTDGTNAPATVSTAGTVVTPSGEVVTEDLQTSIANGVGGTVFTPGAEFTGDKFTNSTSSVPKQTKEFKEFNKDKKDFNDSVDSIITELRKSLTPVGVSRGTPKGFRDTDGTVYTTETLKDRAEQIALANRRPAPEVVTSVAANAPTALQRDIINSRYANNFGSSPAEQARLANLEQAAVQASSNLPADPVNVGIDRNVPQTDAELETAISESDFGKTVPATSIRENSKNLSERLKVIRENRETIFANTAFELQAEEALPKLEAITKGLSLQESKDKLDRLLKTNKLSQEDWIVFTELLDTTAV